MPQKYHGLQERKTMSELAQFHAFVGAHLQSGDQTLSPEDVFDMWLELQSSSAADDATEDIREALADMEAGDNGITIEEFRQQFRKQFPIP
jgi:hypothetical protein